MYVNVEKLEYLIHHRAHEVETSVQGTGYLPKTVMGVAIFLLDNQGDYNLLTHKQRFTFDRFLRPLLEGAIEE